LGDRIQNIWIEERGHEQLSSTTYTCQSVECTIYERKYHFWTLKMLI